MSKGLYLQCTTPMMQQMRCATSFQKLGEWYQNFWRPPAPKPPYKHICQIGDPLLRNKAEIVQPKEIKSEYVQKVIKRMKKVMRSYDAVGLAAPQIGVPLRILAIEFAASKRKEFDEKTYNVRQMQTVPFKVFINPELKIISGEKVSFPESCESIKGFSAVVPRYNSVKISGLNHNGQLVEWLATGWAARIVQHEMDHLDGRLYTDIMDRRSFNCAYWHSVNVRSGRFSLTFAPFKKW